MGVCAGPPDRILSETRESKVTCGEHLVEDSHLKLERARSLVGEHLVEDST